MCALVKTKLPFICHDKKEFFVRLAQWIGEVFYEILPEHGYEIREEQIYTAFQIADAVGKKKVHFAEAGLGTGKTFAYLLTAISYARFTGKPAVIACASTALQEQLAGPRGDIETLSRLLDLDFDVRMAKDPRQYICDVRVGRLGGPLVNQPENSLEEIICWAEETERGERSDLPQVSDHLWAQVAWDETMHCETCSSRGFCKLARAREHYRPARDLIVGDHGIFFDDLWTRDERIDDGKLPLLPAYSMVIIDEGHKVMLPAAMRAGRQIIKESIADMVKNLEQIQGARTSLVAATAAMRAASARFFKVLHHFAVPDERAERIAVNIGDDLLQAAETLRRALGALHFELQNEQELHTQSLDTAQLQIYEARIERSTEALGQFCRNGGSDAIIWIDRSDGSFWVVPRDLSGLLNKFLFTRQIPTVFSSATLSTGGDFSYFARTLGLAGPSTSSVASAFDFAKQVLVYLPQHLPHGDQEVWFPMALEQLASLLQISQGRALVLTNSPSQVRRIRAGIKDYQFPFEILWEDSAERGYLVRRFRENISSVLVGSGFWEGIDVPGEALSLIVVWQLPFPPLDPLIEARRREAQEQGHDEVTEVDYPEMGLKLKQGCGRLIRKSDDRGVIAILEPVLGMPWEQVALAALPQVARVVKEPNHLTAIFK